MKTRLHATFGSFGSYGESGELRGWGGTAQVVWVACLLGFGQGFVAG